MVMPIQNVSFCVPHYLLANYHGPTKQSVFTGKIKVEGVNSPFKGRTIVIGGVANLP